MLGQCSGLVIVAGGARVGHRDHFFITGKMIGERRLERRRQFKGITGRHEVGLVSVG